VTTVVGSANAESDGNRLRLSHPTGIVVTQDGFIFISDESRGRIVRITPEGDASVYAGGVAGFADGVGAKAGFNGPRGIAINREGTLYVADSENYIVREVYPFLSQQTAATNDEPFIQPATEAPPSSQVLPDLEKSALGPGDSFPWPLAPQDQWHEVTGVAGEARGAPGGIALDHVHSGLDIRARLGDAALSVYDEKITSPIGNWDSDGAGEGVQIGLFSYIHIRVGRSETGHIQAPDRFKARTDASGRLIQVRIRRGTRFEVGDFIGSVNRLNHIHLNLGPWNAQANPLQLPFFGFKDTIAPTVEPDGIRVVPARTVARDASVNRELDHFAERRNGRVVVSGDVAIVVTAYDRVDGNGSNRKLGLFRLGYQLLNQDGTPAQGFEEPLINIEFNRLPAEDSSVFKAFATGSGVSAYGTPTRFKYIVTNRVRDGEAVEGLLRTPSLPSGNYVIKVIAEDYAGNRASGTSTELPITIAN